MLSVNGEMLDIQSMTLAAYLVNAGFDRKSIAVERNGDIVPKSQYDAVVLQDGDVLEIVRFVGGG